MARKSDVRRAVPPRPATATEAPEHDSARLEALFASIGEGVIATNERGIITRINQAALDLLGVKRRDVMRKHFLSVIIAVHDNGTPLDVYDRPIVKAFQTGRTVTARVLYVQKDGTLLPVQVTVSPIILHGRPIGAIEVFRDLTDEIESDKLKSDFISIASHQLRTPLSAINMYTRMLHDGLAGPVTDEQLPYIDTVLLSVKRMNTLINTLLNITRIEAGGIIIKKSMLQLDELSQEVLAEFIPSAEAKSISLTVDLPEHMAPTNADSLLIKEICGNLLSNAIKYTAPGGHIEFSLTETPKDLHWKVSDNGYGIPAGSQKNIFLKFFRAENITNKDVSGTGLGLYLIKNIAESLGGELWFESTEDVGSTFHFLLPKDPA
ncbi:MAG TPA: ATP-binding protein [Candidatus Saccharimonadales bacterium]|nr:ATP-binding protein [Candidatus Saccharimonadales bacterium]